MSEQNDSLLEAGATPEKVSDGGVWVEGPVWLADRHGVRYSDIKSNSILEFSEGTGELTVITDDANNTNGRTLDLDGNLIECSHRLRAVQKRVGDDITVLVDRWNGVRLNSPNDVVVKSDGTIWFTDPAYGIESEGEGLPGEREYGDRWLFCFDPASGDIRPAVTDTRAPNGLAFSPDESLLYVADSSTENEPASGHHIRVYDIVDGRLAKDGRVFAAIEAGVPDGFRVDVDGNVWSSAHDGVHVFSPDGELLESIPVPEVVSNLCFGGEDGRTLYMTASTGLYRIRTTTTDCTWGRLHP